MSTCGRTIFVAILPLAVGLAGCGSPPCEPSAETPYYLPYTPGTSSLVVQANRGWISHINEDAIDFLMPIHTPLLAVRDGMVSAVNDTHTKTCWLIQTCAGNHVIIRHDDGTQARYWHLEHGGALVVRGQRVRRGETIGYSGQTGIAFVPHLHFSLRDAQGNSIKTRFAEVCDNNGSPRLFYSYTSRNTSQPSP